MYWVIWNAKSVSAAKWLGSSLAHVVMNMLVYSIFHKKFKMYCMHYTFFIFIGCLKYAANKNNKATSAAK